VTADLDTPDFIEKLLQAGIIGGELVEAPRAAEQLSTPVGIRRSLAVSVEIAIRE